MKFVILFLIVLFVLDQIPTPRFLEEKDSESYE